MVPDTPLDRVTLRLQPTPPGKGIFRLDCPDRRWDRDLGSLVCSTGGPQGGQTRAAAFRPANGQLHVVGALCQGEGTCA